MCAIIGWNGKITKSLLREFFRRAESSGPMSTGLMTIDKEPKLDLWKRAVPASYALRNHNRRLDRQASHMMGIGHTRYATHGHVCDENAHPFSDNDVHFVHNGVIQNYRTIKPNAVVDSQCLGPLIHKRNITPAYGSVGLAWFEKIDGQWKMFVYRHSQSLCVCVASVAPDIDEETSDFNVTLSSNKVVLVASRLHHFPQTGVYNAKFITLEEGIAYEVTPDGVTEAWRNPNKAIDFQRATHRDGCYIGG